MAVVSNFATTVQHVSEFPTSLLWMSIRGRRGKSIHGRPMSSKLDLNENKPFVTSHSRCVSGLKRGRSDHLWSRCKLFVAAARSPSSGHWLQGTVRTVPAKVLSCVCPAVGEEEFNATASAASSHCRAREEDT